MCFISWVISFTVLGPAAFKCSATIPSSPDALLFFSLLICLIISFSSGSCEFGLVLLMVISGGNVLVLVMTVLDSLRVFQSIEQVPYSCPHC